MASLPERCSVCAGATPSASEPFHRRRERYRLVTGAEVAITGWDHGGVIAERSEPTPPGTAGGGHVAVVGGGIAGLTAAHRLGTLGVRVTLLESSAAFGGKLARGELAGLPVDTGAESLLFRRPEAADLAREVGLAADLCHPEPGPAAVWTRGSLRPLPPTVLGVPSDLVALARSGAVSLPGVARAAVDRAVPRVGPGLDAPDEVSVGGYVARRLGPEVRDRLLEPLLGGVYAGHAGELSLAAAAPQLLALAREHRSLLAAARRSRLQAATGTAVPVFVGLAGGVGRLAESVAAASASSGVTLRTGATVRSVSRLDPGGGAPRWRLLVGRADRPERVDVDAVVLATPAAPAARLLHDQVPPAARELARIDYASVAIVSLAVPAGGVTRPPPGPGFLVPPIEGRAAKAATWSSAKWAWVREQAAAAHGAGTTVARVSFGRHREVAVLQRDDTELVALARAELADAVGLHGPVLDARVDRWGGGLPQYAVGHLGRVGRVESAVSVVAGLEVCGAAYHGMGVAACIADGQGAAERTVDWLRTRPAAAPGHPATMQP